MSKTRLVWVQLSTESTMHDPLDMVLPVGQDEFQDMLDFTLGDEMGKLFEEEGQTVEDGVGEIWAEAAVAAMSHFVDLVFTGTVDRESYAKFSNDRAGWVAADNELSRSAIAGAIAAHIQGGVDIRQFQPYEILKVIGILREDSETVWTNYSKTTIGSYADHVKKRLDAKTARQSKQALYEMIR